MTSKLCAICAIQLFIWSIDTVDTVVTENIPANPDAIIFPTNENQLHNLPLLQGINLDTKSKVELTKTPIQSSSEAFALDLIRAVAADNFNKNFFISPFSVWILMVLIAEAAIPGQSLAQLQTVLRLPSDLSQLRIPYKSFQHLLYVNITSIELNINQAIISDTNRPLHHLYIHLLKNSYEVNHFAVNFHASNAANIINEYLNNETRQHDQKLVRFDDLDEAQVLLISSIFFRGQWKYPFDVKDTKPQPFYHENGHFLGYVPMMTQQNNFQYVHDEILNATIVELPYGNEARFTMLLIYPHSTLTEIFKRIKLIDIAKIHLDLHRDDIDKFGDSAEGIQTTITLPKFTIDSDLELRSILRHLGIIDVFDGTKSNLLKMSQQVSHVSNVIHKANIRVDELGSVASASTTNFIAFSSLPQHFIFDHPFAFLITDRITHTLMFAGQIREPIV